MGPGFRENELKDYTKPKSFELRDYFAGRAMAALLSEGIAESYISKRAYEIADLMLSEREKGTK